MIYRMFSFSFNHQHDIWRRNLQLNAQLHTSWHQKKSISPKTTDSLVHISQNIKINKRGAVCVLWVVPGKVCISRPYCIDTQVPTQFLSCCWSHIPRTIDLYGPDKETTGVHFVKWETGFRKKKWWGDVCSFMNRYLVTCSVTLK